MLYMTLLHISFTIYINIHQNTHYNILQLFIKQQRSPKIKNKVESRYFIIHILT